MAVRAGSYRQVFLLCTLLSFISSCSKKDQNAASSDTDFKSYSLYQGKDKVNLDLFKNQITIQVPDSIYSGSGLIANYTLASGASLAVNGVNQQSGVTKNNFEADLKYTVTAQDQRTQKQWTVQATNNDNSLPWGLGHFVNRSQSEDRGYTWYIDQGTSGTFAPVNCGPASVTMAIKWADSAFSKTAVDARATYQIGGGWWFTSDVDAYLNQFNITHAIIGLGNNADSVSGILRHQLDQKQIIILCLDMDYVRSASNTDYRVDKFYPTTPDWGHFIVLKGYQIVDGKVYLEAFDPYSFGITNGDQTLKGMNRFYRNEDLAGATFNWWNYAFVIAKKGENLSTDAVNRKLNPAQVPVGHSAMRIF